MHGNGQCAGLWEHCIVFQLRGKAIGMRRKRRSAAVLLVTLCSMMLFLAGCGAGLSSGERNTQTAARLLLHATPKATALPTTSEKGTYLGKAPNQHAWIGLLSTGQQFVAFVTDGTPDHAPTFAQWFRGSLTNNAATATASARGGQARLQALLSSTQAVGTVMLANGTSIPFSANVLTTASVTPTPTSVATPTETPVGTATSAQTPTPTPASGPNPGLYRSERTVNGTRYIAGWIVLPAKASGTATPTLPADQGGAILNQSTSAVQSAPAMTAQDQTSGQIAVPSLGTFNLLECTPLSPC
jgi:hypothetical protein